MKIKNVAITLGLSAFAALAVGAGLKAGAREAAKAEAVSTIYLSPNANWKKAGAVFGAKFNGDDDYALMSATDVDGVYSINVPNGKTTVQFGRMDPNDTDTVWNTSNDNLAIPEAGSNNLFAFRKWNDNNNWGSDGEWVLKYEADKTVYVYDADDYYELEGNAATVHMWSSVDFEVPSTNYPGAAMTVSSTLNGHKIYSYTDSLVSLCNYCAFNAGGTTDHADFTKTVDLELNPGLVYNSRTIDNWNNKYGRWYTEAVTTEASNFVYGKMKMSSYDKGGVKDTQTGDMSCLEFYGPAKTAYNGLSSDALTAVKTVYSQSLDRLAEWAKYNSEVFDPQSGFASSALTLVGVTSTNNAPIVIVVLSSLILLSAGGFFFIRKRKEDK